MISNRTRLNQQSSSMFLSPSPPGPAAWLKSSLAKDLASPVAFLAIPESSWMVYIFHTLTATLYHALTPELKRNNNVGANLTSPASYHGAMSA